MESRYRFSYLILPSDVDRWPVPSVQYTSALFSLGKGGNGGSPSISYLEKLHSNSDHM